MAAAKKSTAKKVVRKKASRKKRPSTGSAGTGSRRTGHGGLSPTEWMALFSKAQHEGVKAKGDFQSQLYVWLATELHLLEPYRGEVQRVLMAGLDPRESTGIQLGVRAGQAVQAFDEFLLDAVQDGHFELHPWVMPSYAAMAIQGLRNSGLSFWLATGSSAEEYVERSLSVLIPMLGRVPD